MPRKRRKYPQRVYASNGALFYVEDTQRRNAKGKPIQRWHRLCRIDDGPAAMHEALGRLHFDRRVLPCSVAGVIAAFREDWLSTQWGADTQREYGYMLTTIDEAFVDFDDIADVRPADIAEFLADRYAAKPRTAHKFKALFSALMAFAIHKGFRDANPARELDMRIYKQGSGRSRYLTDDELARIKAGALDGTRTGAMIVCMIDLALITGQRISDVLSLTWAQVSDDGIIFRPAKVAKSTGVVVPVKMTPELRAVLDQARGLGKVKGLTVIHTMRAGRAQGKPLTYSGAYSAWRRACARAEPPVLDANIHDLRHRSLTDAKAQGKNAQALGGHADAKMTERYIEHPTIEWIEPPRMAGEK